MKLMRAFVPATAAAASLCLVTATGAFASHDRDHCKADVEAEATVHGTGHDAMHAAKHAAVVAWKHEVAKEHGWAYAHWRNAQERDVRCDTHKRKDTTECEVEADPCH